MKFNTENPVVRDELWIRRVGYVDYPTVRRVRIEIDTRQLSVEEEESLINDLENVPVGSEDDCFLEDLYREVKEVQLPECVDKDADNHLIGKLIYTGRITDNAEDELYEVLDRYDVKVS